MDWRKGDLALCVDTSEPLVEITIGLGWAGAGAWLQKGRVYTVSAVGIHPEVLQPILWLEGVDRSAGAFRFRKINGLEADAFDREVIEALKSEPVHVPQHDALHNGCQCEVSGRPDAEQVLQ